MKENATREVFLYRGIEACNIIFVKAGTHDVEIDRGIVMHVFDFCRVICPASIVQRIAAGCRIHPFFIRISPFQPNFGVNMVEVLEIQSKERSGRIDRVE